MDFYKTYRVYYEDTDAGGVMYHSNYLNFAERTRTEFLHHHALSLDSIIKEYKGIFVVKECNIKYIKSAKLEDLVNISCKVQRVGKASITFRQDFSLKDASSDTPIATLDVVVAFINNQSFKPQKMPEDLKSLFI